MGAIQQVLASYLSVPPLPAGLTNRWTAPSTGSDGDLIATLTDSIAGNNGTAAGSARPTLKTGANGLNGRNVLRFDGVANAYDITPIADNNSWSMVAVVKRIGTEACPISNDAYLPSLVRTAANVVVSDQLGYSECASAHTGWEVLAVSCNNGTRLAYLNGSPLTVGANNVYLSVSPFKYIGKRLVAGSYSSMDLRESLLFSTVLTAQELIDASTNVNAANGGVY
jgi:hypothetical protein